VKSLDRVKGKQAICSLQRDSPRSGSKEKSSWGGKKIPGKELRRLEPEKWTWGKEGKEKTAQGIGKERKLAKKRRRACQKEIMIRPRGWGQTRVSGDGGGEKETLSESTCKNNREGRGVLVTFLQGSGECGQIVERMGGKPEAVKEKENKGAERGCWQGGGFSGGGSKDKIACEL